MGAKESILKAAVSTMIPKQSRAAGYGLFECSVGVFWFPGSWLMGGLYDVSLTALTIVSIAAQVLSLRSIWRPPVTGKTICDSEQRSDFSLPGFHAPAHRLECGVCPSTRRFVGGPSVPTSGFPVDPPCGGRPPSSAISSPLPGGSGLCIRRERAPTGIKTEGLFTPPYYLKISCIEKLSIPLLHIYAFCLIHRMLPIYELRHLHLFEPGG